MAIKKHRSFFSAFFDGEQLHPLTSENTDTTEDRHTLDGKKAYCSLSQKQTEITHIPNVHTQNIHGKHT